MPSPQQVVIHLHIPKNAGTTLSRMLKLRYGVWPPHKLYKHAIRLGCYDVEHEDRLDTIERLPERDRDIIRFFEAHAGYGVHHRLPGQPVYLTVLREPIDRTLSVFYHMIEEGHLPKDASLLDYVTSGDPQRVWWVDNAQVRYLASDDGDILDMPHGTVPDELLAKAKQRLESFAWFGVTERFDAGLLLLGDLLGIRRPYYGTSNVTGVRKKRHEIDPEIIALIEDRNRLDTQLHRWALERVDAQIAELGPGFAERVKAFRARNQRHNATLGRAFALLPKARQMLRLRTPGS